MRQAAAVDEDVDSSSIRGTDLGYDGTNLISVVEIAGVGVAFPP